MRELAVIKREADIVDALRGGPLDAPAIASVIYARQQLGRGQVSMVAQSLRVLERDGVVRRFGISSGRRYTWELA